jgi:TonB-linked SusC/RagA family outer membrane protein
MNLDKYIPKAHSLTVLLGQEIIVNEILTTTMEGQGFPDFFTAKQAWNFMNYRPNSMTESGTTVTGSTTINNYYGVDDRLASFFGRVNYNFKDRYLLSATMRADGSSRFYKGNQWGYFPSGAFAWRLSEEDFMKNVQWLDNLKWRLSFGAAGNNNIPGGQTQKLMSSRSTSNLSTAASIWTAGNTLDNPDLRWETMITRNTGIDFNLFNFRLGGTVDLYWNNTKDLLLEFPIAGSGYATQFQNMGKAENKGVEITLNGTLIQTRKITLDANFNIGFNKSRVVSLGNLPEITASSGWASSQITYDYKVLVGQSLGVMYGYITDGRYSADNFDRVGSNWVAKPGVVINEVCPSCNMPGGLKLKDVAGDDGIVNKDDIVEIGNATPKFTGGFGLNVKGFGFDLSTFFTFVYGNNIYNANKIEWTSTAGYDYRNMLTTMESGKRWTFIDESGKYITDPVKLDAMNANTTMWSPYVGNFLFHSWAVEDGSFLRCNNITLGYTLPKRLSSKAYIQSLRLYCTLSNVFIITNYTGFDPEVDTRRQTPLTPGVDYSAYPRSKGTTLGINMTF